MYVFMGTLLLFVTIIFGIGGIMAYFSGMEFKDYLKQATLSSVFVILLSVSCYLLTIR